MLSSKFPLWMTPRPAVAENLAQFVAFPSHSRFSRKNKTDVVPACIEAFCNVNALWNTDDLASSTSYHTWVSSKLSYKTEELTLVSFSTSKSTLLFLRRNST